MTTQKSNGNRQSVPADALKFCPSCGQRRGNVKSSWTPITRSGQIVGYTCVDCPAHDEPIRREDTGGCVRFVAVIRGTAEAGGKRRQMKRRFDSLEDARQWVSEVREGVTTATARRGQYRDRSQSTVSELAEAWLTHRRQEIGVPGGIRENTLAGYRKSLHSLLALIGSTGARELTAGDIETALHTLARDGGARGTPLAHRSLTYALVTLRQVFKFGVREGVVKVDATADVKPPREDHSRKPDTGKSERWSPQQVRTFRDHIDIYGDGKKFAAEPWIRAGMRLTLCGLRRSEVLGLDWQNVDLELGTVTVAASRVATGNGRATVMGPVKVANSNRIVSAESIHSGTAAALRELWMSQGRPATGLVISNSIGMPVHPDLYSKRFGTLCRDAGVPRLRSIHNVRHTLAGALESAGVATHHAASLLGHDTATYMRFYLSTDDDGAATAAQTVGAVFAI